MWDESTANRAILNILHTIAPLSDLQVSDLKKAAVALEEIDLNASYRLMSIAKNLKPDGPFILRKLDQYKKRLDEQSDHDTSPSLPSDA